MSKERSQEWYKYDYREYSCLIVENNCYTCLMLTTNHLGLIYWY